MDNKPNNLPPEGWVLKMEHDHPRKGEVIKWFMREWHICYRDDQDFYTQEASFYKDDFHLPRLSMDEFISLTIDFEKEPEVGSVVEGRDTDVLGLSWSDAVRYIGKTKKGGFVTENQFEVIQVFDAIRPVQPLTLSISEAEKRLSEIENRVVKIEG